MPYLLINLKVFSTINMIGVSNIIIINSVDNIVKVSTEPSNIIMIIHLFHNFIFIANINKIIIIIHFHNFIIRTINYFAAAYS